MEFLVLRLPSLLHSKCFQCRGLVYSHSSLSGQRGSVPVLAEVSCNEVLTPVLCPCPLTLGTAAWMRRLRTHTGACGHWFSSMKGSRGPRLSRAAPGMMASYPLPSAVLARKLIAGHSQGSWLQAAIQQAVKHWSPSLFPLLVWF